MRKAIIVAACAALLPAVGVAGVVGCALNLMRRRPLEGLYAARAAQDDFVPLRELPERFITMLVGSEDREFYRHKGYNCTAMRRAARKNRQAGEIVAGGSTITQQLAKNLYLRFHRSYARKAVELVIACEAERRLGKDKILELYLNVAYYGNGVYGIGDAARFYFGKEPKDLTVNQMFMLVLLPIFPTKGNPIQYPQAFERLRNKKLAILSLPEHGLFTEEEAEEIRSHHADRLDPELREADAFTDGYPRYVTLTNERFGPFRNDGYRNPME
jgi:membrane peptidoglycan carboxypeptidase